MLKYCVGDIPILKKLSNGLKCVNEISRCMPLNINHCKLAWCCGAYPYKLLSNKNNGSKICNKDK